MSTTWIDCRPESDEEAWTMPPSNERRQLLEEIAGRMKDRKVRPEFWAFLQVGDLAQIRHLSYTPAWHHFQSSDMSERARLRDTLQLWLQRREVVHEGTDTNTPSNHKRTHSTAFSLHDSPTPPPSSLQTPTSRTRSGRASGTPEGSVRRDVRIAEQSKQRDGNLCVITKMSAIEACHIYPWCAFGKNKRVGNFWDTLGNFWPAEKVDSWRRKIFPADEDRGKETVKNMVTFTATVHKFHSDGAFALRPVRRSADNTQLELEFHWLKRQARENTDTLDITDPPLSSQNLKSSGLGEFLFRWDGDQSPATQLQSGYRFIMETDDCEKRPLPDTDLLELQWHLQRIFAMSGAAGWKEDDDDDDDDDDNVDPQRVQFSASASDDDMDHRQSSSSSSGSDDHDEDTPPFKKLRRDSVITVDSSPPATDSKRVVKPVLSKVDEESGVSLP